MDENQTMNQIKNRLEQFIDDIDHVNPNEVKVEDIDEWIGLLDQLEEKLNQYLSKEVIPIMFKNCLFWLYHII